MRRLLCKLLIPPNVRGCCSQRTERVAYAVVEADKKGISRISPVYDCHLHMLRVEGTWKGDISALPENWVAELKKHLDQDKTIAGYILSDERKLAKEPPDAV